MGTWSHSLALTLLVGGCAASPLEGLCPDVAVEELVVTEIRGSQSGDDTYGEWIELANPTARDLDLEGLRIRIVRLDGSRQTNLIVRRPLSVAAGARIVLGRHDFESPPSHVDYGFAGEVEADSSRSIFDSGAIEVMSCGERVDLVVYRNLPARGTLVLSGDVELSTAANDDEQNWCVDDIEDENSETLGISGTPREENPSCS